MNNYMREKFIIKVFLLFLVFTVPCFAVEEKNEVKAKKIEQKETAEEQEDAAKKFDENELPEVDPVVEINIGTEEGRAASKGLPQNIEIVLDEKTFAEKGTLSIYSINRSIGIDSYKALSPIWAVACNAKFKKRAKYIFEFEKETDQADPSIVVLTWWNGNWILAGIPEVNFDKEIATIELNYSGWFVIARLKSRDEIRMRKYTFPDGDKRKLLIVGYFSYDTVCPKGEDLLEEKVEFVEHFAGDITFYPIERNKRTGIKVLSAEAVGKPDVLSFESRIVLANRNETIYATSHEIPKQRGVISAQLKDNKLIFDGMPTIIVLKGLMGKKEVALPTVRGNLNLSGMSFDWKWQEMFHIKNFTYKTEMTMPHGTGGERTRLVAYLQFIVK